MISPLVSQRHLHFLEMKWNCSRSNENSQKKPFRHSDCFWESNEMSIERTLNLCQDNRIESIQGEGDFILSPCQGEETEWVVTLLERQFFHNSLTIRQKLATMFNLGYIFKDVCRVINLEREIIFLWGRGQICYVTSTINIMFLLGQSLGMLLVAPCKIGIFKVWGSSAVAQVQYT